VPISSSQIRQQSCAGELCGDPVICPTAISTQSKCGECDFDGARFRCVQVFFVSKSAAASISGLCTAVTTVVAAGAMLLLFG